MDHQIQGEFSDLQFWIISQGQKESSRLTLNQDGSVTFTNDGNHAYDEKKELNKLWKIALIQGKVIFKNQSNGKYLRVNVKKGEFQGLKCKDIDSNDQSFLWTFNVNPYEQYSFIIESSIANNKYERYVLYNKDQNLGHKRIIIKIFKPKYGSSPAHDQKPLEINGFAGKIIGKAHSFYRFAAKQYATGSYPTQKMSPYLIFYPHTVQDVKLAISYALQNKKFVVARSGGHQYSGKSSGGDDTVVIDLGGELFTQINVNQRNKDLLDVGPGVKLKNVSKKLVQFGYSLPHGQCPLVCIGGHAQSGGYGHLLRAFGLNGDYVEAFQIVITNGIDVNVYEVVRPNSPYLPAPTNITKEFNDKLFTGVLTGNAGSFGVVTRYTYKVIKDQDHPNAWGYQKASIYKAQTFKAMMQQCKKWSEQIKKGTDDTSLRGLDYMMTLASTKLPQFFPSKFRVPLMLVQLVYSDLDKKPYENQFKQLITVAEKQTGFLDTVITNLLHGYEKSQKLSVIADSHVRKWPLITINGREFNRPYKKRINLTYDSMSDQFIDRFCGLVNAVFQQNKVKLIFQMGFGGGQVRRKGNDLKKQGFLTYPHRESVYNFVFDLFYSGQQEQQRAIWFQEQMQKVVDECFSNGQQKRLFWGTFGDTDMSKQSVIKMYYDPADYARLQQLKKEIDPTDVFHTSLTVKLPSQAPVKTEQAPVKTEQAPVKTEQAPVKTEQAPVKTEQDPVKTD